MSEEAAMHRVLYTSRSVQGDEVRARADAQAIARHAATANARRRLTGALVFVQDTYIQVLEGPGPAVEQAFEGICRDFRHAEVKLVDVTPITERLFGAWSMALLAHDEGLGHLGLDGDMDDIRFMVGINARQAMRQMRDFLDRRAVPGGT